MTKLDKLRADHKAAYETFVKAQATFEDVYWDADTAWFDDADGGAAEEAATVDIIIAKLALDAAKVAFTALDKELNGC